MKKLALIVVALLAAAWTSPLTSPSLASLVTAITELRNRVGALEDKVAKWAPPPSSLSPAPPGS